MATWEDVRRLALALPEAKEEHGPEAPFFTVGGSWFVVRSRLEPDAVVVHADRDERRLLADSNPAAYSLAPRFERGNELVVHLGAATTDELRERLLDSWLLVAPKRLVARYAESESPSRTTG